jgi:hypothetical protein
MAKIIRGYAKDKTGTLVLIGDKAQQSLRKNRQAEKQV